MCGIAGVVDRTGHPVDATSLLGCLRHRGPDSVGTYERPGVAIGQTRLAVIDLVTGDPPVTTPDGAIGVAFNGEIYNYQALRSELRQRGHQLTTTGDTEVICHLAEELEPVQLAQRLDGMFAFAVWDERRQRLVLGRDRFGKKPLYWWHQGGRFVFGSEIKAVASDPDVPTRLEPTAISAHLHFGYVPSPRTFFEGIHSLAPAHVLTLSPGGEVTIERYWSVPVQGVDGVEALDISFEEASREVRRLLVDAVDRRMVADVPLGAYLSGGVDSTAIVACMARLAPQPPRTFTIGFEDEAGFDERPHAARTAALYGTEHTEFVVQPDKVELIERLVWHHDQPFGDSSALPSFLLAEMTRRHVTVALSGDGGDELFGGYERFAAGVAIDRMSRWPASRRVGPAVARRLPVGAFGGRAARAQRMLARLDRDPVDAYFSWLGFMSDQWQQRLVGSTDHWALEDFRERFASTSGAPMLERLLAVNAQTYLVDDLLPKADRMAMAHGLEVRSPLLDTELAELAFRLPSAHKVRGMSLKRVLKSAVRDLVPKEVLSRRKHGFAVPLDRWFRTDLKGYVDAMLCSSTTRTGQHLKPEAIRELVTEHQAGVADHGHAIWTLLTLEVFLRHAGW